MTLEVPAPHPRVPLFEKFIFQNLTVSFGISFFSPSPEKSVLQRLTKNELPKLTARFWKINYSNSGTRGCDAGPSRVQWSCLNFANSSIAFALHPSHGHLIIFDLILFFGSFYL